MRSRVRFGSVVLHALLFACAVAPAAAQRVVVEKKAGSSQTGRPPRVGTPTGGGKVGKLVGPGRPPVERDLPVQPRTIRVRIRYNVSLGYLELYAGAFTNVSTPTSCNAFDVRLTTSAGAPGTVGGSTRVGGVTEQDDQMKIDAAGEQYSCWYTVGDLPLNQPISVMGKVIEKPEFTTASWLGGTEPQPQPGYTRAVLGHQVVTLTPGQPGATVDLVMKYVTIPRPPR